MSASSVASTHGTPPTVPPSAAGRSTGARLLLAALGAVVLLVVLAALSLLLGSRDLPPREVWLALSGTVTDANSVVATLRLPRTAAAVFAGASFAVAGALMQALTRNALAEPGLLGVNAGAAFAIALGAGFLGITATGALLPFAFLGAFAAALLVFVIGGVTGGNAAPARLVLTGVALGAVLSGITQALVLSDPASFTVMTAWTAGSLEGRAWGDLLPALPPAALAAVVALGMARALNVLSLGEESARALGVNTVLIRAVTLAGITVLAGSGTAVAGPVGFVGLLVPLVVRALVGPELLRVLALSLLIGPSVVLAADIIGRLILPNGEVPVGIVMGVVGAPVLIWLSRRRELAKL
ncbi:FecCD family ABC transporter permease [Corynebacterium halotolerans]|uniref:FecCD family ABC transporter permease n=1 Tax=Corynebacterium halotolerans TaxID=225326 RepID=UPI00047956A9|nr:iron ABC transporter permease [Corynebacterium halotolerans]